MSVTKCCTYTQLVGGLCEVFIHSSGANSESVHVSNEVDCLAYIHTDIINTHHACMMYCQATSVQLWIYHPH